MKLLLKLGVLSLCYLGSLPLFGQNLNLVVPTGHADIPTGMSLSPDGNFIGSWDLQKTILWEVKTGRQLRDWATNSLNMGIYFLPDGKAFAGPTDGATTRRIYDLTTLQPSAENFTAPHRSLIFSPDGKYYANHDGNGNASIGKLNSLTLPVKLAQRDAPKPNAYPAVFAVSPQFKYGAVGGQEGRVDIWRFDPNSIAKQIAPLVTLTDFTGALRAGAFAPDEDRIVVGDGQQRLVCYSISQQKELWRVAFTAGNLAFTSDGKKILATQDKNGIYELDAATGAILGNIYKPQKSLYRMILATPNRLLITGDDHDVLLLSYPQMEVLQQFQARADVTPNLIALPEKNQVLAGYVEQPARLWDLDGGKLARTLAPIGYDLIASPTNNTALMAIDGFIEVINLNDFTRKRLKGLEKSYSTPKFIGSPDGKMLLLWGSGSIITLYDLTQEAVRKQFSPWETQSVDGAAFSDDGKYFALAEDRMNEVRIYNRADSSLVKAISLDDAHTVVFLPDGRLAVNGDKVMLVFDQSFQLLKTFAIPRDAYPGKFQWLPDRKRAVVERITDTDNIMLLDFERYAVVRQFTGHTNSLRSLSLLADGKHFVTGSHDNSLRLWSVDRTTALCQLFSFKNSTDWVVVTPDGRFDGSPGGIEQLYFVRGIQTIALSAFYEKFYTPNLLPRLLQGEAPPAPNGVDDDIKKLKAPPIVKINPPSGIRNLTVENDVSTLRRYATTSEKITIIVEAASADDRVAEIRLFQNGKLVGGGTRNLTVEDVTPTARQTQSYEIQLGSGENHFRAVALNSQRTESRPDEIIVAYQNPLVRITPTSNATLHLLVIGINQYKNPKYNLNYAVADATAFKAAVEAASQGVYAKVNAIYLGDEKATRSGVIAELEKVKATAQAADVFIFYYAGHGMMTEKNVFHLVPFDVTQIYGADDVMMQKGVSAGLIQQYSRDIKAQKQLFILDACQSAAALNNVAALRGAAEEKAIAQLARATGTHWLTATGSEQVASEFRELGHGTFTFALLEALRGKADTGNDRKITVKEVDAYLQDVVPQLTTKYRGAPQYPASFGFGNDFPIGVVK